MGSEHRLPSEAALKTIDSRTAELLLDDAGLLRPSYVPDSALASRWFLQPRKRRDRALPELAAILERLDRVACALIAVWLPEGIGDLESAFATVGGSSDESSATFGERQTLRLAIADLLVRELDARSPRARLAAMHALIALAASDLGELRDHLVNGESGLLPRVLSALQALDEDGFQLARRALVLSDLDGTASGVLRWLQPIVVGLERALRRVNAGSTEETPPRVTRGELKSRRRSREALPPASDGDRLLTISECCTACGISRQTFYNWLNDPSLGFAELVVRVPPPNGRLRIRESRLREWLDSGRTKRGRSSS